MDGRGIEAGVMVIDARYLYETPCYYSSLVLDQCSVFEFPPKNTFGSNDIAVSRSRHLPEYGETTHVIDFVVNCSRPLARVRPIERFADGLRVRRRRRWRKCWLKDIEWS